MLSSKQCAYAVLSFVVCHVLELAFSTLSHKRYGSWKRVIEHKMFVLIFSTVFVWNLHHSRKNWTRYDQNCIVVFLTNTPYSCPILMNLEFSRQLFEKYSNIGLHENPWSGSRVFFYEDRLTEKTKLIVASRNFANKTNKLYLTKANGFPFSEIFICLKILGRIPWTDDLPKSKSCTQDKTNA